MFMFHGDCGFCRSWAAWLLHRTSSEVSIVAFQDVDDLANYGLAAPDPEAASFLIDKKFNRHRGAEAFAHALRAASPAWRLPVCVDHPRQIRTRARTRSVGVE
ncbi:MAG: DUF393 domain-containing protein [Acidimicrobiales bacterium]|nr:DUF393 domain-containing protein [Acidimicrobiales bacterium]